MEAENPFFLVECGWKVWGIFTRFKLSSLVLSKMLKSFKGVFYCEKPLLRNKIKQSVFLNLNQWKFATFLINLGDLNFNKTLKTATSFTTELHELSKIKIRYNVSLFLQLTFSFILSTKQTAVLMKLRRLFTELSNKKKSVFKSSFSFIKFALINYHFDNKNAINIFTSAQQSPHSDFSRTQQVFTFNKLLKHFFPRSIKNCYRKKVRWARN